MTQRSRTITNLEALALFWRRSPFHDECIQEISALNKRVLIRLTDLTLVITRATDLTRCELPAVWLCESVVRNGSGFRLDVETETGRVMVGGSDVRLIRNRDLAMLIPPIDT